MTDFLLYVAIPGATLIIGAILGAWATRGIDRGMVATVDDRPFIDAWADSNAAERPATYPADMETDVIQALRLSDGRPKPYPPLKSVPR